MDTKSNDKEDEEVTLLKELRDHLAEATQHIGEQAKGYNRKIQEIQQLNQRATIGGKDPREILHLIAPEL
ncbi:hypothetical protein S40288_11796 [Stachybotrys chartarum IBT 40288]|nr:hypothetical protein S40288_11796 [Stachybotrys chartarum IBT 40288]